MSISEKQDNSVFSLPDDPEKLKLLVADYSRRLQNALHTIEAQKQTILKNSLRNEDVQKQLARANRHLELEVAKNANLARRKQHDEESRRYERSKVCLFTGVGVGLGFLY